MDFEDNNPLGVSDEEVPRPRVHAPSLGAPGGQRIVISEAGKSREGGGRSHITYTIRLAGGSSVRRRYSEFESLRRLLRRLFPCVVVPQIPEKHSLGAYAASPAHAHEDGRIIEHRQRLLADFLNRCVAIPMIHDSWVLERFLDPNTSWREVLHSDFVQSLPDSPLKAPPINPANATPAHAHLPTPAGGAKAHSPVTSSKLDDASPAQSSASVDPASNGTTAIAAEPDAARDYELVLGNGLERRARKLSKHYSSLAAEYADLGGQFNSFSLDSHGQFAAFAPAVERVGQAVDQGYITTTQLVDRLGIEFAEPLSQTVQMAATARQVLHYRRMRELQVPITEDALARRRAQLTQMQAAESEAQRISSYLRADDRINAATAGSALDSDRDHVVDRDGEHDRDHTIDPDITPPNDDGFTDKADQSDNGLDVNVEGHSETSLLNDSNPDDSSISPHSQGGNVNEGDDDLVPSVSHASDGDRGSRRGFKVLGLSRFNHALHGVMDVDPQTTRRNNITRAQEHIQQLEAALEVAKSDAHTATNEVRKEMERYNGAKREDIKRIVRAFVRCHREWAEKNLESWLEAKNAIANS